MKLWDIILKSNYENITSPMVKIACQKSNETVCTVTQCDIEWLLPLVTKTTNYNKTRLITFLITVIA